MSAAIVIFTGPTLSAREAQRHLDAIYLPPVEQGMLFEAVNRYAPRAIGVIDGAFGRVPAVRHNEILWAIHRGIHVVGAASMGALRAAELYPQGMAGFGRIYRWYRRGLLIDDDEVAVAMGPSELGSPATSDALVNIRVTLRRAQLGVIVTPILRRRLEDLAASIYFPERSYEALWQAAQRNLPRSDLPRLAELSHWAQENGRDQKREDAVGMIRTLASAPVRPPPVPPEEFVLTQVWVEDLAAAGLDTSPVTGVTTK